MDPVTNPYSPGAGRRPAAFVGRDAQLQAWENGLKRIERGRDAQSLVLFGLRGVGKTVLLSRCATLARDRGWLVAKVEARNGGGGLRQQVGDAFHDDLVDLLQPGVRKRVLRALKTALSFKASYDTAGTWNFGLDLDSASGGGTDTGRLEADLGKLLRDLSAAADDQAVGVALLVDEAQDLSSDELVAVRGAVHRAHQDGYRLLIALAGLPSLPRALAEAKSYSERLFAYHQVDALDEHAAQQALSEPAAQEDVAWNSDALEQVLEAAAGYPYFLQQYGQETWNAATASPITVHDANVGLAQGDGALDNGFFRVRWDRTTAAEKKYLRAMAQDGDAGSSSSEVAARLDKKPSQLGPARASLIAKGLIYAPDHGIVAYTVPAMSAFIRRQPE